MLSHSGKLATLLGVSFVCVVPSFAATPVDLRYQTVNYVKSLLDTHKTSAVTISPALQETSRSVDFNHTLHVRMQETYAGYSVWGGDVIVHVLHGDSSQKSIKTILTGARSSQTSMHGTVYQDLANDLQEVSPSVFTQAQADRATKETVISYNAKANSKSDITNKQSKLMIYVDIENKAHWAYLVSFHVTNGEKAMPEKPSYILDATTFKVYKHWNNIQTMEETRAGGFGGNKKMGKFSYDGLTGNLPVMNMYRDIKTQTCFLDNAGVVVQDYRNSNIEQFKCEAPDKDHGNNYWNADFEAVNDGFSPGNDALYAGKVINEMYLKWYGVPALTANNQPMKLVMKVHADMDNAFWDGSSMTFGDGETIFYPLTSLGVAAHEISHGFTEQHSALVYDNQSGGLNEAFSDMAAQAAEFYSFGKNSWQIGPEIFKADNEALRYMDQPSRDCHGGKPGNWCSIDNMSQYKEWLDVHYSSGIFNRVFYLIGTANGWTAHKAFDVMVQANMHYWTANTTFAEAACGVIAATKDYGYNVTMVNAAFETVGIDTKQCAK
ncbi:MAG: hypothetical protein A3E84_01105 [Gammaproteobacteria bacterium RIFCSPHIGHO2_12_FULL_42_13]|nr:MAG: hypothetical protein A3E84_01105 [Gammaproteobacteria bacterium RIFCSPHIGHO2_12_FULL_42_13]